jgi:hypothetical protein
MADIEHAAHPLQTCRAQRTMSARLMAGKRAFAKFSAIVENFRGSEATRNLAREEAGGILRAWLRNKI